MPEDRPTPVGVPRPAIAPAATFKLLPPGATIEVLVFAYHEAMHAYMALAAENATLAAECREHMRQRDQALEVVSAEVVILGAAVRHVTGRVAVLEGRMGVPIAAPHPPSRPPVRSKKAVHDWSEDLEKADEILRARVKNKRDPMTSERARDLAKEVVKATSDGAELSTWRAVKALPKSLARKNSPRGARDARRRRRGRRGLALAD